MCLYVMPEGMTHKANDFAVANISWYSVNG
jgi:hypothetical protein